MTTISGLITTFALVLFLYANFGVLAAAIGGLISLGLFYALHRELKRDPQETGE